MELFWHLTASKQNVHFSKLNWLTNFYDFWFKWTATAGIGIHPTKAWLSQLVNFKNAIWHFRRTICNTILLECFRLLLDILHESSIRDSRKAMSLWRMMRGVVGVRKSIHHSWLAKRFGFGFLCWGFKGVQLEIPWEEASTLQIGSVEFLLGQYTSPQLHRCHRLLAQAGHQDSSPPSL